WGESQPGEGSTFVFSLPVFGLRAQAATRILLVAATDDGTRREVHRVAEELGYSTHEVADGVETVEATMRLAPAAVILDRVLPRLGAEEVARRLRENPATADVPLFVLAPRRTWAPRRSCSRAGCPSCWTARSS